MKAEDEFFSMLDCAKAYCDYKNSDSEDGEELSDEETAKITAYAIYLNRLSEQTYQQTGEGL
jgi:hypothetical protein